jgi:hypothetical protein
MGKSPVFRNAQHVNDPDPRCDRSIQTIPRGLRKLVKNLDRVLA